MTTRAAQIEILASGVIFNGTQIANPYAVFRVAGTSTPKDAWADKDKSVSFTKLQLDTQGRGVAYGDGIYDINVYSGDPDAAAPNTGVLKFQVPGYKVQSVTGETRVITENTVGTTDDFFISADTSGGNISYTLPDATLMAGLYIFCKKKHADNTFTVVAPAGQTLDDWVSIALSDVNEAIQVVSDGTNWEGAQLTVASGGAETLNGYTADAADSAGTIPVRNGSAQLPGDITGNAATATLATNATNAVNATAAVTATKHGVLNVKVSEIGDWNMDVSIFKNIYPGVAYTKIRAMSAMIIRDDSAMVFPVPYTQGGVFEMWFNYMDTNDAVRIYRLTGGYFDNANFDATSFNRGFVTIWYID